MQRLQIPPPPPGTPGPLSRPTPQALGGLLEAAGFSDVEVEEAEVTFQWQSPEEFTTFIREIAPPITAMIAPHPQEVQNETWATITKAIRDAAGDGEAVTLSKPGSTGRRTSITKDRHGMVRRGHRLEVWRVRPRRRGSVRRGLHGAAGRQWCSRSSRIPEGAHRLAPGPAAHLLDLRLPQRTPPGSPATLLFVVFAGHSPDAGGGTRTPDTRIMIRVPPPLIGSSSAVLPHEI